MLLVEVGPQKTNPRDLAVGLGLCGAGHCRRSGDLHLDRGSAVEAAGTPILEPAMPLPELSASKRPADLMQEPMLAKARLERVC